MWLKYRAHLLGFGFGFVFAGAMMMVTSLLTEVFEINEADQLEKSFVEQTVSIDTITKLANNAGYKIFPASEQLFTQTQLDQALQEKLAMVHAELSEQTVEQREMAIFVSPGMTVTQVSQLLVEVGYLTDAKPFIDLLKADRLTDRLRVGMYSFAHDLSHDELIRKMTSPSP